MSENDKPRGEPAVKAKLPDPKTISRTEFTPHGIGAGRGRPPKLNAKTAAKAKKRRQVMVAGLLVAVMAIAGAGAFIATRPGPEIEVIGAFGKEPKLKFPKDLKPTGKLKVSLLRVGTGAAVTQGATAYVSTAFYKWDGKTNKLVSSTYQQGQPVPMTVGETGVKGVDKSLVGEKAGSRLLMEVPPAEAFGKEGNPQAEIKGTDTLVFVLDVIATFPKGAAATGAAQPQTDKKLPTVTAPAKPGTAPKFTIPKNDPPKELVTKVLIQGTGPVVAKGDSLVTNYAGVIWKTGKTFDSSWEKGQPVSFPIGTGGVVPGWDKGLVGQKVGSRVLLVLPPKEGYGKTGQPQAGIKGTDTLVFEVDILGTLPKQG